MARTNKTVISIAVAGAFSAAASQAFASSFALIEQSGSGLGYAYAGAAAAAEDASTIFYNPAGMTLLKGPADFSIGAAFINLSAKFADQGSQPSGTGLNLLGVNNEPRPLGGTGGNAGGLSAVPNLYIAQEVAPDWKVGLGISVPFGLKTQYEGDWLGRFQAVKSDIMTLNINPSVAWKVNNMISLGAGVSYQQIDAELSQNVNWPARVLQNTGSVATTNALVPAANAEGRAVVYGSDGAWGYNLGAMIQAAPNTRIGLSYRSSIKYHITGGVSFDNAPPLLGNQNTPVSVDLKMPDSASLAISQGLGSSLTLLADVTWTGWSKIQNLTIVQASGAVLSSTPENFKNTYRYGLGAIYRPGGAWTFKAGVAFDQTPVNDTDRTPRLPDQDRTWLSFGAKYGISNDSALDVGYAHLFIKDASINQNAGSTAGFGLIQGTYTGSVDIFGVQFSQRF